MPIDNLGRQELAGQRSTTAKLLVTNSAFHKINVYDIWCAGCTLCGPSSTIPPQVCLWCWWLWVSYLGSSHTLSASSPSSWMRHGPLDQSVQSLKLQSITPEVIHHTARHGVTHGWECFGQFKLLKDADLYRHNYFSVMHAARLVLWRWLMTRYFISQVTGLTSRSLICRSPTVLIAIVL